MTKEIVFKIEAGSEKDFQKIHESLRVQLGNYELARLLKIIDLGVVKSEEKGK